MRLNERLLKEIKNINIKILKTKDQQENKWRTKLNKIIKELYESKSKKETLWRMELNKLFNNKKI